MNSVRNSLNPEELVALFEVAAVADIDAVPARETFDRREAQGPFEVQVLLDLREPADEVVGCGAHRQNILIDRTSR